MRISHRHKFIFLSNPKCGSESIRRMLSRYSDVKSSSRHQFRHHLNARQVTAVLTGLGIDPRQYFIFTTIRNPWDRMVSIYTYGLQTPKSVWHKPAVESEHLDRFVQQPIVEEILAKGRRLGPFNLDGFVRSAAGKVIVDRIIRLEDISVELPKLLGELVGHHEGDVLHINSSMRSHYRGYYESEDAIVRVAKIFASDIRFGDYTF